MRVKLLPKFESGAVARISGPNEKKIRAAAVSHARPPRTRRKPRHSTTKRQILGNKKNENKSLERERDSPDIWIGAR